MVVSSQRHLQELDSFSSSTFIGLGAYEIFRKNFSSKFGDDKVSAKFHKQHLSLQ